MAKGPYEVLASLCNTVEATGGLIALEDGAFAPVGDPDWIDLADVYLAACEVVGRTPKIDVELEGDESEEEGA